MRVLICLAAAVQAVLLGAAVHVFPDEGWKGAKTVRTERHVEIYSKSGKKLLTFLDPRVKVEVRDDCISIDPAAAFEAGSLGIIMDSYDLDLSAFGGRDVTVRSEWKGRPVVKMRSYLEGHTVAGKHYYTSRDFFPGRVRRKFDLVRSVPDDLKSLHLRFDIMMKTPSTVEFYGATVGTTDELPPYEPPSGKVETLFHATFDGTAAAAVGGAKDPACAKGVAYAPGIRGNALVVGGKDDFRLEYPLAGNALPDRGTVAMWIKRQWPDDGVDSSGKDVWRTLFAFLPEEPRLGSGSVKLWWWGRRLRADQRDAGDESVSRALPYTNGWQHVAMTWSETGVELYVDGRPCTSRLSDDSSPLSRALNSPDALSFKRAEFSRFSIGGTARRRFSGLIDEVKIFSQALSPDGMLSLYRAEAPEPPPPDWEKIFSGRSNPFEKDGGKLDLELIKRVSFAEGLPAGEKTKVIGKTERRMCDGSGYLQLGSREGDRMALGFDVDTDFPLYVIDVDYPDDAVRTADVIVQSASAPHDYALQVGYAAGAENGNTGRILTHRMLYWTRVKDVALVMMTARKDAPAAVSEVRVYKVRDGKLPMLKVNEPPAENGWNRMVGVYYEDPAIGFGFGTESLAYTAKDLEKTIDGMAAYMKYIGANLLAYPAAWYHGLIEHEGYNPRRHPRDVRKAWYVKFDREGLFYIPTINPNNMPVAEGLVTRRKFFDGSLHDSPIAIHDTGKPNPGKWHGTPPNFCFAHPEVQKYLSGLVDTLIAEGLKHPSFKGIALHVTPHNMLTFGSPESGFNDYCIEEFEKKKGVKVPVSRTDPLRGREYARWIRRSAYREWVDWRCEKVAEFWLAVADRLSAARSDLKLFVNALSIPTKSYRDKVDENDPMFMDRVYREASIDPERFRGRDNIILCRTLVPADGRFANWRLPEDLRLFEERRLDLAGNYSLLHDAAFPWLNHHDRYWESPIGRGKVGTLSCDWLSEMEWRVSTINPSGISAMRDIVRPFRFSDILGFSKGGFLVGTYGMEDPLRKFAAAFRALPAEVFTEIKPDHPFVRVRGCRVGGKKYFYIVNTGPEKVEYRFKFPAGTRELTTGKAVFGDTVKLGPWDFRSFSCR